MSYRHIPLEDEQVRTTVIPIAAYYQICSDELTAIEKRADVYPPNHCLISLTSPEKKDWLCWSRREGLS